jgi:hypothetical protein
MRPEDSTTMMFRKLYWVTEEIDALGHSQVSGVYTSIPDLIRHGLRDGQTSSTFRLTLTKLDSEGGPLGTWTGPRFEGLAQRLEEFILTDEFSREHGVALLDSLLGVKV